MGRENRLREARMRRGLSLGAASAQAGISKSMLAKLESGDRLPSVNTILTLATFYGTEPGELFFQAASKTESRASA